MVFIEGKIMENLHLVSPQDFEYSRLQELYSLNILDTEREDRIDSFTRLIADVFDMPIAFIGLIDSERVWFKSCIGLSITEIPRDSSFCTHTIHEKEILVIQNAKNDERFRQNPFVLKEPTICFYAGAVLRGPTEKPIGALCIVDTVPRDFDSRKQRQLVDFARLVEHELCYTYNLNMLRSSTKDGTYGELPNRNALKERLEQTVELAQFPQQIAVISLTINQLQELKTAVGSDVTHFIINETRARLSKILRKSDGISLWEDDHFVLFITINPQTSSLLIKLELILKIFEDKFEFNNENYTLSTRIGISIFPSDSNDANQLVDNSIYAMRLLTVESKPPYRFFSEESTTKLTKQFELAHLLRKAMETKSLELYFQPKVDVSTGLINGAEALCRWNDDEKGQISPKEFIAVAEQTDLIIQLGEWVLREACKKNKEWQLQGFRHIPISVNVSKKQLMKKDFHQDVKRILSETKLKAKDLDLEITESALMHPEDIIENLNAIRKLGITFSLDDFGTGFSSLSYLKRLPIQTLKIDISFIKNMVTNKRDATMVRAIIAMAKSLNIICIAEGVENAKQLLFLQAFQCDQIQGKVFSMPLSADVFTKLLSNDKRLKKML